MRHLKFSLFIFCILGQLIFPFKAFANKLIADVSDHLVAVTTGFTGTEVVMFGTREGKGDIVVVVEGPRADFVLRKKTRVGGLWMNQDSFYFQGLPSFYRVASTSPIEVIAPLALLQRHSIGVENIRFKGWEADSEYTKEELRDFTKAMIKLKVKQGFFSDITVPVYFLGENLFRTTIYFPSNIPVGLYKVHIYLIEEGKIQSAQTTPLAVSKIGFNAEVYELSQLQPITYSIIAVFSALILGLFAGFIFRRG